MKTDSELRTDVEQALAWEPGVTAAHIGVAVDYGTVTLSGHIPTWAEKWCAEKTAKRVLGVKGLANEIKVIPPGSHQRSDTELANAAVRILQWRANLPSDRIQVTVKDGCLLLEGEVETQFQRRDAESALRYLTGMRRLTNAIQVQTTIKPKAVKQAIQRAFERSARLDAAAVQIEAHDHVIVLRGTVSSWAEKDEAEEAAWAAPGVLQVDNHIQVID